MSEMSKFIIEKIEEIDGQEKKLYYESEYTWTTVFGQAEKYDTYEEASKILNQINAGPFDEGYIVEIPTYFIIEKTQKIQGQEKKLYYKGEMNWTTVFGQRRLYETREEAEKDNNVFIRDVLNIHRDGRGSIVTEDFG